MKRFPYFIVGAVVSFILTISFFAAASDDRGLEHWIAQEASALAAIAAANG